MKTKNKIVALMEVAIVLCAVFLVALPAIAAEQTTQKVSATEVTTASEDDYVLGIYGNANEDDTIDMRDFTYTARIICWLEEEADLADANYDGEIDVGDMTQIGLIILGRESELTLIDYMDRTVTVNLPINRIISLHGGVTKAMRMLRPESEMGIVGIPPYTMSTVFFPEISELPVISTYPEVDVEKILSLEPDIVLCSQYHVDPLEEQLPASIPVVVFSFCKLWMLEEELKKLGYILGEEKNMDAYCEFHDKYIDLVKERTEGIPEGDKPKVYYETVWGEWSTYGAGTGLQWHTETAGGINIFAEETSYPVVDGEAVAFANPDIIIRELCVWMGENGGYDVDDFSGMIALRYEMIGREVLKDVTAVPNGTYVMCEEIIYGVSFPVATIYLAKIFHPDLFADVYPEAVHQEFLDIFPEFDYDVTEHGTFVYPEPPEPS